MSKSVKSALETDGVTMGKPGQLITDKLQSISQSSFSLSKPGELAFHIAKIDCATSLPMSMAMDLAMPPVSPWMAMFLTMRTACHINGSSMSLPLAESSNPANAFCPF